MNIPPGVQIALAAALSVSTGCSTAADDSAAMAVERQLISDRLAAAARACLSTDIASLPCVDHPPEADFTPEGGVSQFGARLVDGFRESRPADLLAGISIGIVVQGASSSTLVTAMNLRELLLEGHARREISSISRQIGQRVTRDRLDRCHSMCLIQCVTSGALIYDDEGSEGLGYYLGSRADEGPYAAAASGRGICRNYVSIAQEIGGLIGEDLDSVLTDSGSHRGGGYAHARRAYLFESQENPIEAGACNRYPVP